jgi:dolichol kinase
MQHVVSGIGIFVLYHVMSHDAAALACGTPTVIFGIIDYVRRNHSPRVNAWFIENTKTLLRPEEHHDKPSAAIFFLFGITVTLILTRDPHILLLSILYVTFCDPAASIFGIMIPSPQIINGKSVSGSCGAITAGLVCALWYSWTYNVQLSLVKCAIVA